MILKPFLSRELICSENLPVGAKTVGILNSLSNQFENTGFNKNVMRQVKKQHQCQVVIKSRAKL